MIVFDSHDSCDGSDISDISEGSDSSDSCNSSKSSDGSDKKISDFFFFLFIALKIVTKLKNSLCDKNSKPQIMTKLENSNGNRIIADLRYGGKDIISPSTLNFAPIKG